jgi:hypothetical protein
MEKPLALRKQRKRRVCVQKYVILKRPKMGRKWAARKVRPRNTVILLRVLAFFPHLFAPRTMDSSVASTVAGKWPLAAPIPKTPSPKKPEAKPPRLARKKAPTATAELASLNRAYQEAMLAEEASRP